MNERKTENIVRNILQKNKAHFDTTVIEEQKSDNPRIDKLLQHASKRGGGYWQAGVYCQFFQ
ncbi:MAG: hypothetical protein ACREGH_03605 [Minisyncoccia bacterium]